MRSQISRRGFLKAAGTVSAFTVVPRHVLGGPGHVAPNDKIALGHIGMGTQAFRELGRLLGDPRVQIVAVCDPNTDSNDYIEWGKGGIRRKIAGYLGNPDWRKDEGGCPGGREVGRQVADAYYARERAQDSFKACAAYADYRELLENEKNLDAIKIMTPDHLHACIAVAAMKKGIHVETHKPLANRLYEGRLVVDTARQTKVATHLLAYGAGAGNGEIVERIKQGVIGPLREIHNWTNRPVWPHYTKIPTDRPPVPKGFDWDLWLGPEKRRPYHPHYTHTVFRGWYDFGGGCMADMGIYSLWPVFAGLELDAPTGAEAWASHTCAIVDGVSRPVQNDFAFPAASTIRLTFAPRGGRPALDLFWYDGGMKPRLPCEFEMQNVTMGREGMLYVGDDGAIIAGFMGQNPRIFAGGQNRSLSLDGVEISGRRDGSWIDACRGGAPSPGRFENAAAITDAVNLGTVALRVGRKVTFDSANMRVANDPSANKYLFRDYRKGWEL